MSWRPDLAQHSASSWREPAESDNEVRLVEGLRPPEGPMWRSPGSRWRALWNRDRIRREQAKAYVKGAFDPERGLPVATNRVVLDFLTGLLKKRRGLLGLVVGANAIAAIAGLLIPMFLGFLVDRVVDAGGNPGGTVVRDFVLVLLLFLVIQTLVTFVAKWSAARLGQGVLAAARECVVRSVLQLPLGRVESASTGDLVTRITRDVSAMSVSVRWALPEVILGATTVILTLVAMFVNSWLLALPTLIVIVIAIPALRSYFRDAPTGYLHEGSSYSRINSSLTESVEGARTVEALGLQHRRRGTTAGDIGLSAQVERYTMTLRNKLFVVMDNAFGLPRVVTLIAGAVGYHQDWVSLGQITTAMLYVEAFYAPFDRLVTTLDELQVGVASTTRLLGVAQVPPDRTPGEELPDGRDLVGNDLHYAYREGHDVLHGIDLDLATGERLAIVGPSGSGKSTLGRLMAGIHAPREGTVQVGGVELTELPLNVLRQEVALVTQEHHVFRGSVRDNVVLARDGSDDDAVVTALRTVGAWEWVSELPDRLDTVLGSGDRALTPAQSQQIALARLILADPHTLVLDEATSLIDPRTARNLEGSMNALLTGRTVVAIAHRLHTAHDADRIAVVADGRIIELGSHEELMQAGGEYAALWRAWTS